MPLLTIRNISKNLVFHVTVEEVNLRKVELGPLEVIQIERDNTKHYVKVLIVLGDRVSLHRKVDSDSYIGLTDSGTAHVHLQETQVDRPFTTEMLLEVSRVLKEVHDRNRLFFPNNNKKMCRSVAYCYSMYVKEQLMMRDSQHKAIIEDFLMIEEEPN